MVARQPNYFTGEEDRGCSRLAALLGRPVKCLGCPLDKCLYDMTDEEIEIVEEWLRLLHTSRLLLTEHA